MNDSNWKKLVDLVNAVSRRYRKAPAGVTLSVAAFESINASASSNSVQVWSAEEENALREQHRDVKVMDIYDIKTKQFPSRAEILLELSENEIGTSGRQGRATWISGGLKIQETQ
ncbi:hypothetical protein EI94DRAFT_1587129 [Lactarius quietus]|nr:hypothetical protein EI94DRAFT_1587129 [Lactarius quietus]